MTTGEFVRQYYATVGCVINEVDVNTSHGTIHLTLRDYAGQEKYSPLLHVTESDATILMFDLTNGVTYRALELWYEKCGDEPVFVVGNKCDCADIKVTTPRFHETYNLPYYTQSVKRTPTYTTLLTPILRRLTGYDDLVIVE
jgi:GTPase SAR1 family protein